MYVRAQLWVFVLLFRPWISAAVIVRKSRYLLSFNYVISECRAQTAVCRDPLCELSFTDLTVRRMVRWICMRVLGERDTVFRCSVWGHEHLPAALSVQSELMTDERCVLSVCEGLHSLSSVMKNRLSSVMKKYGNIREF